MARSPDPWTVKLGEDGVYIDAAGYTIAQVFGLRGNENAALMAAAPEMAALLRLVGIARTEGWYEDNSRWAEIDCPLNALLDRIGRDDADSGFKVRLGGAPGPHRFTGIEPALFSGDLMPSTVEWQVSNDGETWADWPSEMCAELHSYKHVRRKPNARGRR